MDGITIDGLSENDFRSSVQDMLRQGRADDAARRLRELVADYAGDGRILPARFLTITSEDVTVTGWDELGHRIERHDRPDHPISALSISVADPQRTGLRADGAGRLAPLIETSYFSDEAYPFSEADRGDLLDGYSLHGCEWQGDCTTTDSVLAVQGIDDLYGAITLLEARLMDSGDPEPEEICAGSVGACYLSVLIHQAVRDSIRRNGLPRPLCVITTDDGTYPFFDAPVMSIEEYRDDATIHIEPVQGEGAFSAKLEDREAVCDSAVPEVADYGSLLAVSPRAGRKRPVIVLDPDEEEGAAGWSVPGMFEPERASDRADQAWEAADECPAASDDWLPILDAGPTQAPHHRVEGLGAEPERTDDEQNWQNVDPLPDPGFSDLADLHHASASPAEEEPVDEAPEPDGLEEAASAQAELSAPVAPVREQRHSHSLRAQLVTASRPRAGLAERIMEWLRRMLRSRG